MALRLTKPFQPLTVENARALLRDGNGHAEAQPTPGEDGTLEGFQGFIGQTNAFLWGKRHYPDGENGGITGMVLYAVTRAENDPELAAAGRWLAPYVGPETVVFSHLPVAASQATLMRWVAPAVDWPLRASGSAPATLKYLSAQKLKPCAALASASICSVISFDQP